MHSPMFKENTSPVMLSDPEMPAAALHFRLLLHPVLFGIDGRFGDATSLEISRLVWEMSKLMESSLFSAFSACQRSAMCMVKGAIKSRLPNCPPGAATGEHSVPEACQSLMC